MLLGLVAALVALATFGTFAWYANIADRKAEATLPNFHLVKLTENTVD